MKKIVICGSTGSIGTQALEIIAADSTIQVVGLSAGSRWEACVEQAREHGVSTVVLDDAESAESARQNWSGSVLTGQAGIERMICESGADLVLNAVVGAGGLGATIVSLGEGIDLALANKESLVIGGDLVMALAEGKGARIIPVDSEHSAVDQLLAAAGAGSAERITLTASGGPFRGRSDLAGITRDEALAHPTWSMGGKISIDSATMMNKGLELIEAHHLFGLDYDDLAVVVHPQSIVHALVSLNDGATLAHLGYPDMRVPISYAIHFPERADVPVPTLDLALAGELTFEEPDLETFRCLPLAIDAGRRGGTAPCVLNAANEVAVEAFLEQRISFEMIAEVVAMTLAESETVSELSHFTEVLDCDAESRARAAEIIAREVAA
ncbi:MAG: 1-deoxy-D-xylulose-5-phosphate reductoisomerase [bacterium]